MAEENDRSADDLTEEASPYRLEEMRRKGQVAQSRELSSIVALLAAGVATYMVAPKIGVDISEYMREVFHVDVAAKLNLSEEHVLGAVVGKALSLLISLGLPISIVGFIIGVISSLAQIGSIFSSDPLTPDASRIDPLKGLQRILSSKHMVDSLRVVIKMCLVVFVAYGIVKGLIFKTPGLLDQEAPGLLGLYGALSKEMFLSLVGVLALFAAADYWLQRTEYQKSARMTKQESKQEYREREGDPQIKARVRAIQREIARRRMMNAVKKADVIITNPTHFAVAIVYEKDKMLAPKVVAKGADFLAQRIKKVAAEAGIPMVENVPLARTLFKSVKVGQYIPRALF